jgi:hypothetical protein
LERGSKERGGKAPSPSGYSLAMPVFVKYKKSLSNASRTIANIVTVNTIHHL